MKKHWLCKIMKCNRTEPVASEMETANAELLEAAKQAVKKGGYNYKTLSVDALTAAIEKVEAIKQCR